MNGSGGGCPCFEQIEHDASACFGFTKHSADGILDYCYRQLSFLFVLTL